MLMELLTNICRHKLSCFNDLLNLITLNCQAEIGDEGKLEFVVFL